MTASTDDITTATPAELIELITHGFGLFTRQKARLLYAIALFDALNLAPQSGARTTATWLMRGLSIPQSSAHEYVQVARAMLAFPLLRESFLAGNINYSKVRLLLPLITGDNEAELLELAGKLAYSELELALLRYRGGQEGPARESYVRVKSRPAGRVALWANFNAAEGARLMAALKVGEIAWHGTDLKKLRGADGSVDENAVDEELRKLGGARRHGLPQNELLLRSFLGLVNIGLSTPSNPLRSPGAHVNVVMTTDGRAYLPMNPGAPSEAVKSFLSNADYRINKVDDTGLVLNTGRRFRLATDAQINALMLMWRGACAMPGCSHARFMEMHHIHDWADGGTTDLDNLLPLCSACHSMVSDGRVSILKEGGDIHFLFPGGARWVSYDRGLPERNDDALTLAEFSA